MPRRKRRDEWRRTKSGTWTISLGSRGQRVQLFENRKGVYYRTVYLEGRKNRKSLGTKDRDTAERLGRELLAQLVLGRCDQTEADPVVTLGSLCDAFLSESPMLADNTEASQEDAKLRASILCAAIGAAREVRQLGRDDVLNYCARRRAGGIRYAPGKTTRPVRQRSVQADVKLLKQMTRWACTRSVSGGRPWLERDPLQYVSVKGENDVRRPVATMERYEATRVAMRAKQAHYAEVASVTASRPGRRREESREQTWIRAELGLYLLEVTGKRRKAVMSLRWSDIDFEAESITWNAEFDKRRKTWVVPYSRAVFDTLRDFQVRLGALGGFIFPNKRHSERPAPPEMLSQWIGKAEKEAGIKKLEGSLCHAYRRKWRSERTAHPLKAVMVAGGWSDSQTMLTCYDHPDDSDLLAVTSEQRKRREHRGYEEAAQTG